jgi:hypothetical protein
VHDVPELGVEAEDMSDDTLHVLGVAIEQRGFGSGMVRAQGLDQRGVVADERQWQHDTIGSMGRSVWSRAALVGQGRYLRVPEQARQSSALTSSDRSVSRD